MKNKIELLNLVFYSRNLRKARATEENNWGMLVYIVFVPSNYRLGPVNLKYFLIMIFLQIKWIIKLNNLL